jgi:UDP-2-acetamido-2,6-beta-L-arabino-hexul-4-ose reductase
MKRVVITGAQGFIGKNLAARLSTEDGVQLHLFDADQPEAEMLATVCAADVVYHLAGVNRPQSVEEFEQGNAGLTARICDGLAASGRRPKFVLTSSVQAELDNPYGVSKRRAEEVVLNYGRLTGAETRVFRLNNVFGKWCRPNYNSVVATFCYNIAHDLPISISDPDRVVNLVYIDDVVDALIAELRAITGRADAFAGADIPSCQITLAELAGRIESFRDLRENLILPDFASCFNRGLYATYLSYVEPARQRYSLRQRTDPRGTLAEFMKSLNAGQVFLSTTHPGVVRGNHYHHTKTEKFLVLSGEACIRMRQISEKTVHEYLVRGEDFAVVDIPPGYTHSIENVGGSELLTLFWSSEVFNPDRPDTYSLPVLQEPERQ